VEIHLLLKTRRRRRRERKDVNKSSKTLPSYHRVSWQKMEDKQKGTQMFGLKQRNCKIEEWLK
jgi:hypothetical protein